ncbi:MAG: YdcF family protein [Nanoarchaeota archaeon]|nr:YdcF family protein [Nanoarchaeota archaeon]MBU1501580.1 YdcF family protein [Nanoarchaeota archaeon]
MRHKNMWAFSFLALSLILVVIKFTFSPTGAFIGPAMKSSYSTFLGLAFFIVSFLMFTSRQTLDAIMIPTGGEKLNVPRTKKALEKKDSLKDDGYFVISGYYPHGNIRGMKKSQDYSIYKDLRKHGVIPKGIMIEGQAHDTLENVLYSLKKIKQRAEKENHPGRIDVGVVTYHGHFKRFKDFHRMAVSRGLIRRDDFRLHEIPTKETAKDKRYESNLLRKLYHGFKLSTIGIYKSQRGRIKHVKQNPITKWAHKLKNVLR